MCGINGLFPLRGQTIYEPEALVAEMNRLVRHRGPDDEGVWLEPNGRACLGQGRLTIIELSDLGHQPMILEDGTAIAFNGEIYNFRELKTTLPDFDFKSDSDTELLLALYQKHGRRCVDYLVGMFAFAIWDPKEKGLFIARDHIGKKPFYYTTTNNCFAFASELRSLLSLPWIESELDEESFYQFLTFGFVAPPLTMFGGIKKLEPGHSLWVDENGCSEPLPFWAISSVETAKNEAEVIQDLQEKLYRSVDLRMVSDVPIGIFLSGGVDSTGLAVMMRERTDEPIHSFSIGFEDQPDYDETASARATAEKLGFVHHEYTVTRQDMRDMMETIVEVFDEPLADPTVIPIYFLSQIAHEHGIKVILTGDGPDELLLGYRNWAKYIKLYPTYNKIKSLPRPIRRVLTTLAEPFVKSARNKEVLQRAKLGQELFWGSAPSFRESEKEALLSPDFRERAKDWDCHSVVDNIRKKYDTAFAGQNSDENWMSYIGLQFVIPYFYLHRADRLGMRHGVELRAPYLDYDFAQYALSLDPSFKLKNGEPKYILKKAFEPIVSDDVLYRKKMGFCVPLQEWGAEIMVDTILEELPKFTARFNLFNEAAILEQVEQFRAGDSNLTSNIWTLYFLLVWVKKWV